MSPVVRLGFVLFTETRETESIGFVLCRKEPFRSDVGYSIGSHEVTEVVGIFFLAGALENQRVLGRGDLVALLPEYNSLNDAARWALFILILAAGLWISEAMPAFAVGLLVIGLEIAILGRPNGVYAEDARDWERFILVWGSPLIWLFFGGFVLAAAAEKTGLTDWLARNVLKRLGERPSLQLLGSMAVTFVFSMFISNTATATMMMAVLMPLVKSIAEEDRFRKAFV